MTSTDNLNTRRTGWVECTDGPWYPNLPHGGLTAYRIWTQFDGRGWWQRHEWKHADGSIQTDEWIHGTSQHCTGSVLATTPDAA